VGFTSTHQRNLNPKGTHMPWTRDTTKTDGSHETFPIPTTSHPWYHGVANSSPKSAMSTTSPELVRKQAQLQEANAENKLGSFGLRDVKK
jgi:hypothetical protein